MTRVKLAPTVEAIDEWRARTKKFNADGSQKFATEYADYGVDVWTKSSACRCIVGRVEKDGRIGYETIRGEGSSNGCRIYVVLASDIVRAEGWVVGEDAPAERAPDTGGEP